MPSWLFLSLPSLWTAVASTIHDFFVARLCGLKQAVTDPTDAASLGCFDLASLSWDSAGVRAAGIPQTVLPRVVPCGTQAGAVCPSSAAEFGIPAGTPVMVAVGDNQASILAAIADEDPGRVLVLTLGTGAQLSAVMPAGFEPGRGRPACFEFRPFPGGRLAAVAASLAGGDAMLWLAEAVRDWCCDLGLTKPALDEVFSLLDWLGADAADDGLLVDPRFCGERHAPRATGVISGIGRHNFRLGSLTRAVAHGVIMNLHDMLPADCLSGRTKVVGTGNALRRLRVLRAAAASVFGLPVVLPPGCEEAATGAAVLAADNVAADRVSQ